MNRQSAYMANLDSIRKLPLYGELEQKSFGRVQTIADAQRGADQARVLLTMGIRAFEELPAARGVTTGFSTSQPPVPDIFLVMNELPFDVRFDATLYLILEHMFFKQMESLQSVPRPSVKSAKSFDLQGNQLDLSNIAAISAVMLYKLTAHGTLRQIDPVVDVLYKNYIDLLCFAGKDPFDAADRSGQVSSIEIHHLVSTSLSMGNAIKIIAFDNTCMDPHYRCAVDYLLAVRQAQEQKTIRLNNPEAARECLKDVESTAIRVTQWIDGWGLGSSAEKSPDLTPAELTEADLLPGQGLHLGEILALNDLSRLQSAFVSSRAVLGTSVVYEWLPPMPQTREYAELLRATARHAEALSVQLARIFVRTETREEREQEDSGELDVTARYRLEADGKIFRDELVSDRHDVKLFPMLLLDNSCSMNNEKQNVVAQCVVTLAQALKNYPGRFTNLVVNTHHSSGNRRVTMRQLCNSPPDRVPHPARLVHQHTAGLNYDGFALHETVERSKDRWKGAIPILIALGDSWPIMMSAPNASDVREQTRNIVCYLKTKYPQLVMVYVAVNPQHPPESMYDHWISLKTDSPTQDFIKGFSRIVDDLVTPKSQQGART